jgi:hypothetical protein
MSERDYKLLNHLNLNVGWLKFTCSSILVGKVICRTFRISSSSVKMDSPQRHEITRKTSESLGGDSTVMPIR